MRDGKAQLRIYFALPTPLLSALASAWCVKCAGSWDYSADTALLSQCFHEMHVYQTLASSCVSGIKGQGIISEALWQSKGGAMNSCQDGGLS